MKRFLFTIISLTLILSSVLLTACTGNSATTTTTGTTTDGATTTAAQTTEPPAPQIPEVHNLKIAGTPISEYKIVYAKSPFYHERRSILTEYDFWKLIANDIAEKLLKSVNAKLSVVCDENTEVGPNEILVGPTNRTESGSLKNLDVYDMVVAVSGTKLVIGGGYDGSKYNGKVKTSAYVYASTYHAVDLLAEHLAKEVSEDVDLPDGLKLEGKYDMRTIACIGDSITEGVGATDMNIYSYPAAMQRIMWKDSMVINLGLGGRDMRNDLGCSYISTAPTQFRAARNNADVFDYVFIMLGTNDSAHDKAWDEKDDESFLKSGQGLVDKLKAKNENIQFFLFNCPYYYGTGTCASKRVRRLQENLLEKLKEENYKISFFDMNTFTNEEVGRENFPDSLHPNNKGYSIMAKRLSEMIAEFEAGTYEYTLPLKSAGDLTPNYEPPKLTEGAVNILGYDFATMFPVGGPSVKYSGWGMGAAPYIIVREGFGGYTVTDIEFPVSSAEAGQFLTVSVIKCDTSDRKAISSHKCELTYDMENSGWARVSGLNIEVPEGCTLAFGAPQDTVRIMFLRTGTPNIPDGYSFYITHYKNGMSAAGDALAFNVYGHKTK